jgi:hypothetical protein
LAFVAVVLGGCMARPADDPVDVDELITSQLPAAPVSLAVEASANLPRPLFAAASFFDARSVPDIGCPDGCMYFLGGARYVGSYFPEYSDEILRIDVSTLGVSVLPTRLPFPLASPGHVWTGASAYVFGGDRPIPDDPPSSSFWKQVIKFDPLEGTVHLLALETPYRFIGMAGAWDGRHGYLFGNGDASFEGHNQAQDIWRFDAANETLALMDARLPYPGLGHANAFFDSTPDAPRGCPSGCVNVLGGAAGSQISQHVYRYDPEEDRLESAVASLDRGSDAGCVAWDGTWAFLIGGRGIDRGNNLTVYKPSEDRGYVLGLGEVPWSYGCMAAAISGQGVILVGGDSSSGTRSEIHRLVQR